MKVLILAPTLKSLGGIQRYVLTLICALEYLFGKEHIRLVTFNLSDDARDAASSGGVPTTAKLRFVVASLREAAVWRPDLIICAHVGIAPLGKLLRVLGIAPYWVMAYGIDVWAQLRARDHRGLVGADRVVTISEFTRTFVFAIYAYRSGQSLVTTLGAAVMGAALGFLLWNFKPAKIFMGDAGAMLLVADGGHAVPVAALVGRQAER